MLGQYHNAVLGFDHQTLHLPSERYGPAALARAVQAAVQRWQPLAAPELLPQVLELEEHARDLQRRYWELGQLPELVIHGDYHSANLVFREDRIVGVVDYDLAHWCSRAMEVAEAIIAFCTDPGPGLAQIVYPGPLDLAQINGFVTAYLDEATLSEVEIRALPDMIGTIWICASLDPPLAPPLSREAAPRALPEVLALARWAQANSSQIVDTCLTAQQAAATRRRRYRS
jgi:Ser/Thr protein kinase RdoA (MazF antagonist)